MKFLPRILIFCLLALSIIIGGIWICAGEFGLQVTIRHGGTYWLPVSTDSARLSPSMRLALDTEPLATPGKFAWHSISKGFEIGELPVIAQSHEVDRILLARIDPGFFSFAVFNEPRGNKNLDQWMNKLGAALVVNGSYYARNGLPDTPFLSNKTLLGPADYDAHAGAFVSSPSSTGIQDLAHEDWKAAFHGADNAMVSYPLLIGGGTTHVPKPSRWLANRSFVGEDETGQIIIGTTKDAFFSLDRLANFLLISPLRLTRALNLDGGPVASQAVSLNGYSRKTYGRWELQADDRRGELLVWPYGTVSLPIVLAVFPRELRQNKASN